jgi:tRNA U38,U39,U40 pseudouridine synthase TruA
VLLVLLVLLLLPPATTATRCPSRSLSWKSEVKKRRLRNCKKRNPKKLNAKTQFHSKTSLVLRVAHLCCSTYAEVSTLRRRRPRPTMTAELAEAQAAAAGHVVDADATMLSPSPPAADAHLTNAAAAAAPAHPDSNPDPASAAAATVLDPATAAAEDKTAQSGEKDAVAAAADVVVAAAASALPPPPSDPNNTTISAPTLPKRAKKKYALFVAYVGAGFLGMQYNKDQPTIEGTLRDAIVAAGLISQANADAFSKVAWSRAARTDKGVSAVGQVVALRLLVPTDEEGGEEAIASLVNAKLPAAIRVLGASKVRNGFDARKSCDRRRYEYVLPEFAFDASVCCARADERAKKKEEEGEGEEGGEGGKREAAAEKKEAEAPAPAAETTTEAAAKEPEEEAKVPEEQPKVPFVFDDAARDRLNSILAQYEGTHK